MALSRRAGIGPSPGQKGFSIMHGERRWKMRNWLAVASFTGTAMAAVMLGGAPAYAATPQYALTLSQYLGINSHGDIFGTAVSDYHGPIGGDPYEGPIGGNP